MGFGGWGKRFMLPLLRANDLIHDFIRIELVKSIISYTGKRSDTTSSGLIPIMD